MTINAATTTDMVGQTSESNTIPANENVAQGTAGWAFKGGDVANNTAITVAPITLKNTNTAISGDAGSDGKKAETTDVTFVVAADSSTPEDTYVGTVVFTATVN